MDLKNEEHRKRIAEMYWDEGFTQTAISAQTNIPQNTLSDFLCKKTWTWWWDMIGYNTKKEEVAPPPTSTDIVKIQTSLTSEEGCTHFTIPDTQCKPDISLEYLSFVGQYIADRKPDVIIHIGDHADMPSLSSYDKGKKSAEGKRVYRDIEAAIAGMNALLAPIARLQAQELALHGEVRYKPRMVLTLGNHEHRIDRHVDAHPELHGFLGIDSLRYEEMGWEVYPFLTPVVINGVTYCHFMPNPMTGKPYGGAVANILSKVGESFVQGHKQTFEITTRFLPASGKQQWGVICGACYEHEEDYKGVQGNKHFRGLIVQHEVRDGSFQPMIIDLAYLRRRYGK